MITACIRTLLLYGFIILGLRLTGKRQLGQLEPTELVLMMLLSDLAAVPMQDFGIPLLHGIMPIVTLLSLSTLLSALSFFSVRFHSLVCGEPAIVIREGKLRQDVMRRNRITLDELMEELRLQGVSDLDSVQYAVLETSGQLSVLLRSCHQPATPQQLNLAVAETVHLPLVLINDGRLLRKNLCKIGLDESWVLSQLKRHHLSRIRQVFLLTVDRAGTVTLIKKEAVNL